MRDLQVITRWFALVTQEEDCVTPKECLMQFCCAFLGLLTITINCNHSRPFQINKLCDTRMTWRISEEATKSHEQETIDCVSYNYCFSSLERKSCRIHHIEVIPHSFGVHSGICIGRV